MKKNLFKALLLLNSLVLLLFLTSCDPSDSTGDNGDSGFAEGTILIENDITTPTTWETGNVYLIYKYNFYVENTLTIEPGVIVKFHPTEGNEMIVSGSGTIVADGTAAEPIIFTSLKDDSRGGDTNLDDTATTPAAQDWDNVYIDATNSNTFNYCEFYYGGNGNDSTLYIEGDNSSVTNCTFAYNTGSIEYGLGTLDAIYAGTGSVITGNTFYENDVPLSICAMYDIDDSNTFHNPDDTSVTNTYNGIFFEDLNEIAGALSWSETEVAFVIDDNDLYINSGASLTLADNVVLKFKNASELVLDDGEAQINNSTGTGVAFTSYKDDTRKGDTNGDGTVTSPAANDWVGIYNNNISVSDYITSWSSIYYDSY